MDRKGRAVAMETNTIKINWPTRTKGYWRLFEASNFGIEIKRWLEEQGLILNRDFVWKVNTVERTIDITFLIDSSYATLVALQFSSQ